MGQDSPVGRWEGPPPDIFKMWAGWGGGRQREFESYESAEKDLLSVSTRFAVFGYFGSCGLFSFGDKPMFLIDIYIYIYTRRQIHIHIYIYVYIYTCLFDEKASSEVFGPSVPIGSAWVHVFLKAVESAAKSTPECPPTVVVKPFWYPILG